MNSAEQYAEQGFVHVRGVFDPREVQEMRDALDRILASVAGTEHDENHSWHAVAEESVLKGLHNVQFHDRVHESRDRPPPRRGADAADRAQRSQYRDPEDPPVLRVWREEHLNWGQGLMVAGSNPAYWQRRPRFQLTA